MTAVATEPKVPARVLRKIDERVARGAKWLDKVLPGWARKVTISTLNLGNPNECVLGQLAPAFVKICPTVAAETGAYGGSFTTVVDGLAMSQRTYVSRGFDESRSHMLPPFAEVSEYDLLDEAWKREIRARRG